MSKKRTLPKSRGEIAAHVSHRAWLKLWDKGHRAFEIADLLCFDREKTQQRIQYLRTTYNMFPLPDEKAEARLKYARWIELWKAGCTVREIALSQGAEPGDAKNKIGSLRARYGWFPARERQAHGADELIAKYTPWMDLWAEGKTTAQIAERVGLTPAGVQCTISNLRARYGWFPLRIIPIELRKATVATPPSKELVKRYSDWTALWDQGFGYKEIAAQLNLNPGTVSHRIGELRKLYGMFHPRQRACSAAEKEAKFAPWRQMWSDGLSYKEMGVKLGKSAHNVSNTVLRLRLRYKWFPARLVQAKAA